MFTENHIFSIEECNHIINDIEKTEEFYWDREDRKYTSYQIYKSEKNNWIFEKIKCFFERETGHVLLDNSEKIHFHKFNTGNFFHKHNDTRDQRIYSVGVILNKDFDGGDFKLYPKTTITVEKEIGNSYIFDVGISHEITEVTNGVRFSLILFLSDKNILNRKSKKLI